MMDVGVPRLCRRPPGASGSDAQPVPAPPDLEDAPARKRYCCRACGVRVARGEDLVPVDGTTRHERVNPTGWPCRFLTFRAAENTRDVTLPTDDFSWFEGHAWIVLACAACDVHLGWRWEGATVFVGLLLHAIVEEEESP